MGSTGVLTFAAAPNFEVPADDDTDNVYEVQVTVTDSSGLPAGLTDAQNIAITVTDVNDAPTITTDAAVDAAENQTAVVDVQSTDQDGATEGTGLTYSLTGGDDLASYAVDTNT